MEMDLYQSNAAYGAAMKKIQECGRAAVIQPTGTDKLALIWKLLAEHPGEKIVWLVPGAYALRLRQVECAAKMRSVSHTINRFSEGEIRKGLPEHVELSSCEELAATDPRKWVELGESHPAWLILDGYHAIAADLWNRSVARLIGLCPGIRVLGLGEMGVKPSPCLRAQELFGEDAVAACCSVNEAAAAGVMPVPPELVALLWSSRDVMSGLKARVKNLHSPGLPDPLVQLYNNLDYAVRDAEEAAKEPIASMAEQGGRFYVLAEDQEWLQHCLPVLSVRLSHEGTAPPRLHRGQRFLAGGQPGAGSVRGRRCTRRAAAGVLERAGCDAPAGGHRRGDPAAQKQRSPDRTPDGQPGHGGLRRGSAGGLHRLL